MLKLDNEIIIKMWNGTMGNMMTNGVMGSRLNKNNNRVASDECQKTSGKAFAVLSIKKTAEAVCWSEVSRKWVRSEFSCAEAVWGELECPLTQMRSEGIGKHQNDAVLLEHRIKQMVSEYLQMKLVKPQIQVANLSTSAGSFCNFSPAQILSEQPGACFHWAWQLVLQ